VGEAIESTSSVATRTAALRAVNLGRCAEAQWILSNLSLQIHSGDRLAIIGPTGSGKSMLLRALALLDPLQAGHIQWHGNEVAPHDIPSYRSRVIYLHQRPVLVDGNVEANLRQPYTLLVHRQKQYPVARMERQLATLGRNADFLKKQVHTLSGGEAQITAFLRAMQLNPEILLLDEPTSALDSEATSQVEQLVHAWTSERPDQRASVWVTHDPLQATRIAVR